MLALAGCGREPTDDLAAARSPDGRIVISAGLARGGVLSVRVRRDGADLILPSPVGLTLAGEPAGATVVVSRARPAAVTASDRRTPPYGALLIHAREAAGAHRRLDLELRAYDGGAAFRLILPPQPGLDTVRIAGERTRLNFPRTLDCLAVRHEKYVNSHEGDYAPIRADALTAGSLYDLPSPA